MPNFALPNTWLTRDDKLDVKHAQRIRIKCIVQDHVYVRERNEPERGNLQNPSQGPFTLQAFQINYLLRILEKNNLSEK